jgi:hypothetical protein
MMKIIRLFQFLLVFSPLVIYGCASITAADQRNSETTKIEGAPDGRHRVTALGDPVQIYLWMGVGTPDGAHLEYGLEPSPGITIQRYNTQLLIGTDTGQTEKIIASSLHSVAFQSPVPKLTRGNLAIEHIPIPDGVGTITNPFEATAVVFFSGGYTGPDGKLKEFGLSTPRKFPIQLFKPQHK